MDLDPALCRQAMLARDARFDGRFFTAVVSTGIYCRPVCPARPPKAENCIFLPSAAAAHAAGFRPCLRCRPEAAPERGAWRGTSNTVLRALTLIEAGALDHASLEELADRLGVGARQLRRLFMTHLGASPLKAAQTRRVFLAKQLLHETRLPMTEVALASGFRSVRRFNETFKTLYARPPESLRRAAGARTEGSAITLSLPYRPPYAFEPLLGFLAARAIPGVEIVDGDVYRRSIEVRGVSGEISVTNDPARSRLKARIVFPRLDALATIIARLRRLFDLAADPQAIAAALSRDERLAPLVAARPGLRVPGAFDGFELGVRAIVGQQITVAAATRLIGRIAREHGEVRQDGSPGLERLFPGPGRLATAELAGMPLARADAIRAFARSAALQDRLFDRGAALEDSVAGLRRLQGIGPWTAHYIAMRAMGEPDAFPPGDVGLLRALDLGAGRPSAADLMRTADAWRPWRAYAALHLWTSLNPSPGGPRSLHEAAA
jgi:AraC family transcriptional regulator of adaptative response / DNA-3-methyladenine glycosylase II